MLHFSRRNGQKIIRFFIEVNGGVPPCAGVPPLANLEHHYSQRLVAELGELRG